MLQKMRKMFKNEKGQGLVEYILIIAIVAVLAIVVLKGFGKQIQGWFGNTQDKLNNAIENPD
ncbi:MAG: Flp family type IVb pilin [candidate division FCPU426 bacterium]